MRIDKNPPGLIQGMARHWWVLLLFGVLAVLFGLVALMQPLKLAAILTLWAGVLSLFEGGVALVAVIRGQAPVSRGWSLFYALASLAFGVLALLKPLAMASAVLLLVAAWLLVAGVFRIVMAISWRRQIRGEGWLILSGALAVLLAVMFALNPLAGIAVTAMWIGALALVYGVFQIVAAFRLRRFS